MSGYWTLRGFEDLYLEDSWIRVVRAEPGEVIFEADLVLRESHPLYRPPLSNEQYCYREANLVFQNVKSVIWTEQGRRPAVDASGTQDFGTFDVFSAEGRQFLLEGDFGRMEVTSDVPEVRFRPGSV